MFSLAISCLTMSSLPWFMDLTFQVPKQYCCLEHQTLLSPPDTSTSDHRFCFGQATSFFLELLIIILHSSPVASILDTFQLVGLIFQCHIFLPFHTIHGVLMARILDWFAISSSTGPPFVRILHYCHLSWVALHNIAHSFFEFCKPLRHNNAVIPLQMSLKVTRNKQINKYNECTICYHCDLIKARLISFPLLKSLKGLFFTFIIKSQLLRPKTFHMTGNWHRLVYKFNLLLFLFLSHLFSVTQTCPFLCICSSPQQRALSLDLWTAPPCGLSGWASRDLPPGIHVCVMPSPLCDF